MLWLCIYLPLLPLQVFQRAAEAGEDNTMPPFAVTERQKILLCNRIAARLGVEPGMTISTAQALTTGLQMRERCHARENRLLLATAETLYYITPMIAPHRQDSLLLEVGASLKLFGGLDRLRHQAGRTLRKSGLDHEQAIADTPEAAALFARYRHHCRQKGHYQNDDGHLSLHDMPIALLDLPEKTRGQFRRIGLERLGEILRLSRRSLAKRFGQQVIHHLDRLTGETADPKPLMKPADIFIRERFYIDGIHRHDDLLTPCRQLLQELQDYLQLRHLQSLGIEWVFQRFSKNRNRLPIPVSEAQQHTDTFLSLTTLKLDCIPLDSPIECITLEASQFCPAPTQLQDLFDTKRPKDPSLLLDTLRTKLGEEALWQPALHNNHLPEAEIYYASYLPKKKGEKSLYPTHAARRPLWLFAEPEKLQSGDSGTLYWKKLPFKFLQGPERIESHWWQRPFARDYFIAMAGEKQLCWIYYDRHTHTWYLHGIFS